VCSRETYFQKRFPEIETKVFPTPTHHLPKKLFEKYLIFVVLQTEGVDLGVFGGTLQTSFHQNERDMKIIFWVIRRLAYSEFHK
jgi:hypothetical protein